MDTLINNVKIKKQFYKNIDGTFKIDKEGNKLPKKPLSDNSIKQYKTNFLRVAGQCPLDDLSWLCETEPIMERLNQFKLSNSTKKNYLNAIIVILQANEPDLKSLPDFIRIRDEFNKKYNVDNATGVISDKQKDNFITKKEFDNMVQMQLKEYKLRLAQKTPQQSDLRNLYQTYLILELYKEFPLRNELASLKRINNIEYKKLKDDEKKDNYLVQWKTKMELHLNNYKTDGTYGRKILKVPNKIMKLINYWITTYNNREYLFIQRGDQPLSNNNLTKLLTRASNYLIGKNISTTMIRKIYASDKYAKKNEEQKEDADMMGHSTETQNKIYVKKPE